MDHQIQLAIFRAQVENVRFLETARKQLSKSINLALRVNNLHLADVQTKVYAQMFCAWSEANFSKSIHTPYGLSPHEIVEVKSAWNTNGITSGWRKAVEIGLTKVPAKNSNFKPNASQKISNIIDLYVQDPSLLRNKIAHGQWKIALNRENTAVNANITQGISKLDVIVVDNWFECQRHLSKILESLIETPDRTFLRDYWPQLVALEETMARRQTLSLQEKIKMLKRKPRK